MNKKNKTEKWKYWLIEDGSVDIDGLQQFIDENNLKIKLFIYLVMIQQRKRVNFGHFL